MSLAEQFDDYDDYDGQDPWEDDEFDCGMDRSGACSLAGTEDCEFDCPYRAAQRRKLKKR